MTSNAFSDISFIPQKSDIESRADVDLTSCMGEFGMKLPFISSNMPDVTEWKMAVAMERYGCLGILHRFGTVEEQCDQYNLAIKGIIDVHDNWPDHSYKVGVSVGVNDSSQDAFNALHDCGARLFTIDIAHGHSEKMHEMIEYMRTKSDDVIIIAGNVATYWGAKELFYWGANIIKVGVGGGSVCRTRTKTGFGISQWDAVREVDSGFVNDTLRDKVHIISDGAIKFESDIAKALVAGADSVMMGGAFAGTSETPGNVYEDHGSTLINRKYYKLFGGSASSENKGKNRFVEGEMIKVPFKGHVKHVIKGMKEALQSSLSYGGCDNIPDFRETMRNKYVVLSGGGKAESKI